MYRLYSCILPNGFQVGVTPYTQLKSVFQELTNYVLRYDQSVNLNDHVRQFGAVSEIIYQSYFMLHVKIKYTARSMLQCYKLYM